MTADVEVLMRHVTDGRQIAALGVMQEQKHGREEPIGSTGGVASSGG